jgi:cytochrome d ubiquinol oxidase subunit II
MSIVTVILLPVVLIYQGWSFRVFRGRVKGPSAASDPPAAAVPAAPQG